MNILSEDVPGACFWTRSGKTRGLAVGESRISGEECRGVGGESTSNENPEVPFWYSQVRG